MAKNLGRDELPWAPETWQDIDKTVLDEVGRIRIAQKIFPSATNGNSQYVPDDSIDRAQPTLTIPEGRTKPYVELSVEFALTATQVESEGALHTGKTLAALSAKTVAQTEDRAFFQGSKGLPGPPPRGTAPGPVHVRNPTAADPGLLNLPKIHVISVSPPSTPGVYAENTFKGVVDAMSHLSDDGQPGPYALVLASNIYADTFAPVGSTLTTTADRVAPLVTGGFYGTGSMPKDTGLVASLGGDPTTIFVGRDATTEYTQSEVDGAAQMRVFERVQIVARDVAALVRLDFK
jgi:uncharacterized linocin/CFP29 family protein